MSHPWRRMIGHISGVQRGRRAPRPPRPLVAALAAFAVVAAGCGQAANDAALGEVFAPSSAITASAPAVPRAGLVAADLAVVVIDGDPLSEAIGRAYQRARGIPEAQLIRWKLPMPREAESIAAEEFNHHKAALDAQLAQSPHPVQAMVLAFSRPSRVQGPCAMSITSALALGYAPQWCGGCNPTQASPYYDSESTHPYTDLKLRPAMMLPAATLAEAEQLIARGLAADGSQPGGTGWLLRGSDAARNVRAPDWPDLPARWAPAGEAAPTLALRYVDATLPPPRASAPSGAASGPGPALLGGPPADLPLMFFFTGAAQVDGIAQWRWRPGAVADHLTSTGGLLPDGGGQMPATAWLAAGATASYGTVEEPCNHLQKFPKVSVLLDHYLRGATVLEAYWKSVAWPGQGLFIGEPLARPWPDAAQSRIDGNVLEIRSHNWRHDAGYQVQARVNATTAAAASAASSAPFGPAPGNETWQTLATRTADHPRPGPWRVPLPPGTQALRVLGPCLSAPMLSCEWGRDD